MKNRIRLRATLADLEIRILDESVPDHLRLGDDHTGPYYGYYRTDEIADICEIVDDSTGDTARLFEVFHDHLDGIEPGAHLPGRASHE